MGYKFEKYSIGGGGASAEEVVQIVKTNFEGGVGYKTTEEIVPETTNEGTRWSVQEALPFVSGATYEVIFDGTTYTCVCFEGQVEGLEGLFIGNRAYLGAGLEDTGEPFLFGSVASANMTLGFFSEDGSHTFSIVGSAVSKIDSSFFDSIGWRGEGGGAEIFNSLTNKATGVTSHAEGIGTTASGRYSHTEGVGTVAGGEIQHVQGKFNIEDTEDRYAHIVGNGTNERLRGNAHTLDWDGNAWYAGKVKVGGTGYDDPNAVEVGGGSAPNVLDASHSADDFVAALVEFADKGKDAIFCADDGENCRLVALTESMVAYFLKGSTKQLIVVTLGESVSIQYVDIGGGSAPIILEASSSAEDFMAALDAYETTGRDAVFADENDTCRFVGFILPNKACFFKSSTRQLVVITVGASVSIEYVDIGGSGGGSSASGMTLKTATFTNFEDMAVAIAENNYVPFRVHFEGQLDLARGDGTSSPYNNGTFSAYTRSESGLPVIELHGVTVLTTGTREIYYSMVVYSGSVYMSGVAEKQSDGTWGSVTADATDVTGVTLYYFS